MTDSETKRLFKQFVNDDVDTSRTTLRSIFDNLAEMLRNHPHYGAQATGDGLSIGHLHNVRRYFESEHVYVRTSYDLVTLRGYRLYIQPTEVDNEGHRII